MAVVHQLRVTTTPDHAGRAAGGQHPAADIQRVLARLERGCREIDLAGARRWGILASSGPVRRHFSRRRRYSR
jgi:hypothetical protein